MSPFINKHDLEARLLKFEHIYWYDRNEKHCDIIATVLRRYNVVPVDKWGHASVT